MPPDVRSGRLDALLGNVIAERVRTLVGRKPPDAGPGGEWPHTLNANVASDEAFQAIAATLDGNAVAAQAIERDRK
jgi:hypothetical protein